MTRGDGRGGPTAPAAIGVDTGGTFTDVVLERDGRRVAFKVPSTPAAPERAVLAGLERAGSIAETRVRHGSTVATNALLERKVARVSLLTTEGFEDLLEIGRQDRPELYALSPHRRPPLVPRARRLGVRERLGPAGVVWARLTTSEVRRARRRLAATRPEAVAIGLLHAWANPAHERLLERACARLGVPVTRASALCPEVREYERLATTVANAALIPRIAVYLRALARSRRGRFEIVLSHGGTATAERAAREPVRQLLSGPAAGLRAAHAAARACGFARALTLDVGGTSTDCAWIDAAGPPRRRAREVAGVPVLLPALDVHTVGAGGGSIASVDAGGVLHVGPESAGAEPGPAAYGRGGPATVTDALCVLGLLPDAPLAGGALALDFSAAREALRRVAHALRRPRSEAAAEGVVALANAHMEAALRRVSVERGEDPRAAALVAYGGAGGLHACALAAGLGMRTIVWPEHAGVLCALGALDGGARRERSRSLLVPATDATALARAFARLEREVLAEFDPPDRRRATLERWAELRYRGQAHEQSLPLGPGRAGLAGLVPAFHAAHAKRFGFADPTRTVEVVTVEVRGACPSRRRAPRARAGGAAFGPEPGSRVWLAGGWRTAGVWRREALPAGRAVAGPAIVRDDGATLWVAPGWRARRHASGAVLLTHGGSR